jgi:type IV pilus assembly protein PilQ
MIDIPNVLMKASLPSNVIYPVKDIKYKAEKEKVRFIVGSAGNVDTEVFAMEDEIVVAILKQKSATETQQPKLKYHNSKVVSLDFQDADIVPILRLIGEVGGYNIVVHPEVKGTITMKLLNVPWEQALDIVLKTFSLEKIIEGNVIRVVTRTIFAEELKTAVAVDAANIETRVFVVNYADVEQVKDSLEKAGITKKENISIDKRTRSVIVKDSPSNFKEIEKLISTIDKATPQVLIETKIVEVNSSFTRELGIQWGFEWLSSNWRTSLGGSVDPPGAPAGLSPTRPAVTGGQLPVAINLPTEKATSAVTFGYLNAAQTFGLDLRLSAFEEAGKSKTISNPKIITADNQKAKIILGESVPYGEREVSGNQVTISTKFKDVAIIIEVTPQITADDSISLNVDAKKEDLRRFVDIGQGTLAPHTDKVEANTNVLIKNSETMVIGGILKKKEVDSVSGVPGLMNIPILGWLFKKKATDENNTEVLIFITPRIVR